MRIAGRERCQEERRDRQHELRRVAQRVVAGRDEGDGRKHVEPHEEDADQERPDHELGERDRRERPDRDRVVDRPAREDRRQRPQPERERDHEDRRHERQDQRVLDRARDDVPDRRVLRPCASPTDESPRSPWTRPPSQVVYCCDERAGRGAGAGRAPARPAASRRGRGRRSPRRPGGSPCPRRCSSDATNSAATAPRSRRAEEREHGRGLAGLPLRLRHRCHVSLTPRATRS